MFKAYYITILFLICWISPSSGQVDTVSTPPVKKSINISQSRDTVPPTFGTVSNDTIPPGIGTITSDTIPPGIGTFSSDTIPRDSVADVVLDFKKSESGLDTEVDYGGDSIWLDVNEKKYHLYGKAHVDYGEMKLKAGYIIFDIENDIAEAFSIRDKRGKEVQEPEFNMGESTFKYNQLKFNFKTKKGIVTDAITQEGEFYVFGAKTKFISSEGDSLLTDDEIYNTDALITTCNHEFPHYGIRTRKLKIVPNKLAVVGFSQMEIAGVPLPIFLPFGFFPLVKGESSGLIFPEDYEYDDDLGLGFREIGYYFPINDYLDLKLTGDIYTRGTYRIRANTTYRKRYAYSGRINLGFANNKIENSSNGLINSNKSFSINISHNQDQKAHPYRTIGGSINIQTNNYQQRNFNDVNSQLNNRLNSNFYFRHSMPGTPFSFSAGLTHDQNNQNRQVNITLPDIKLNMNQIFPFKRNGGGKEKWYEKFSLKYDLAMKNVVKATDTTLFTMETLDNMQTGVSHDASTNASFNVLSYFNFSTNARYQELWYFTTRQIDFDPTPEVDTIIQVDPEGRQITTYDTTSYGSQIESIERGFTPVRLFNAGFNLSTQIFGTKRFSKGFLRGVRHIMKPRVSFNFSPDSRSRYLEMVDSDSRDEFNNPLEYNPFSGGAIRAPSLSERQMAVRFELQNVVEGKYYSKKDSTEKKFKILNTLNFSSGYNFAADSIHWDDVRFTGNTRILGITDVRFNGTYTPYVYNGNRKTATTLWEDRGKLLEFRNFSTTLSTNIRFTEIRDLIRGKKSNQRRTGGRNQGGTGGNRNDGRSNANEAEKESILDLLNGFSINHRYTLNIRKQSDGSKELDVGAHTISIRGNIPLTKKWNMTLGNISYDIKNKSFVYPTLGLSRDLHCWNMTFNWYPRNGVYSFFVGVKSNTLSFVKYNYGQTNANNFFR